VAGAGKQANFGGDAIVERNGPTGSGRRAVSHDESWLLRERVKELNCLYGISRVFERSSGDLPATLQAVVELIPSAWQYPDVTCAGLEVEGRRFQTGAAPEGCSCQQAPIVVLGKVAGSLTVCYLEEMPQEDEGPFLVEERSLLNTICLRLGAFIEREKAKEQLAFYQHDLRRLASELSMSEQRERRAIAESLHDRIGQSLALINLRLSQLRSTVSAEGETATALEEIQTLLALAISETRSLTFELCPPILYELGLGPALEWLGEKAERDYGFKVETALSVADGLSEQLRVTLFQAAAELLANVAKYASARKVRVELSGTEKVVRLMVADDGVGMAAPQEAYRMTGEGGFGLFNIRERVSWLGGRFNLESAPGHGTVVTLSVPRVEDE
jgi:signal transduction histidine kinase